MRFVILAATASALSFGSSAPAAAQAEPFIAQVMFTGANFCPRGWAPMSGPLLSISQNQALFSLLGTQYGGDGRVTFGLPDLRGRVIVGPGQGPGLADVVVGEASGQAATTMSVAQLPAHTHGAASSLTLRANSSPGDTNVPTGNVLANARLGRVYSTGVADVDMDPTSIANVSTSIGATGGGQPVNNMQPYLGITACIALEGIYPSRN
ncbi:MAG: tail fiber protein [Parvularculaceae bacterium]